MEALRLLSNSYKHSPSKAPVKELLECLKLETGIKYASLPESPTLQKGLAASIGLQGSADYCDIAERFVDTVREFLENVRGRNALSQVHPGPVSLHPKDFLH